MTQVFARYAKDMLEKQTYPEVRREPERRRPKPPYDVTAWSLGMLLGVDHVFVKTALADSVKLEKLAAEPKVAGEVTGSGIGVHVRLRRPGRGDRDQRALQGRRPRIARLATDGGAARATVSDVSRKQIEDAATAFGLDVKASPAAPADDADRRCRIRAPRIGMYQPWTGGNMDEGWTRWVLEQYGFQSTAMHNDDVRAGGLQEKFDVDHPAGPEPAGHDQRRERQRRAPGIPRRHRRRGGRGAEEVRRGRRHARHARRGVGPRDRELPGAGAQPEDAA